MIKIDVVCLLILITKMGENKQYFLYIKISYQKAEAAFQSLNNLCNMEIFLVKIKRYKYILQGFIRNISSSTRL